jgi:hypothetical protein
MHDDLRQGEEISPLGFRYVDIVLSVLCKASAPAGVATPFENTVKKLRRATTALSP